MATDDLLIRLGLRGQAEVSRGLRKTAGETRDVGDAAATAGAKAEMMGARFTKATDRATLSVGKLFNAFLLFQGAQGLGRLTVASVKWGLSFNSQVEQARLRFQLFTSDVNGLTKSVQAIDKASMFNFADLADAAALLGGSGIKDVPKTLQAAANAAAGGGKGTEGLKSIVLALSQIASKGRLSQEEVNQLTEGGAITAQRDLSKGLHLTAKELQNLGGQGIEAKKALDVLTSAWTSGKMAGAAQRQLKTLSGQWGLLTGDLQKLSGLATQGLARDLERNVLPAANRATDQIQEIFGKKGLSNQEKMRQARAVINRELGPIADDLKHKIDEADIPGKLGDVIRESLPVMAKAAGEIAPKVAAGFVEAWIHAGAWARLLGVLYIAKKGLDVAFGGNGKSGAGNLLSKAKPLPVWVVNQDGMPGGGKGIPSKIKDAVKTAGPAAATLATRAAPVAGVFGAALATDVLLAEGFRHLFPDAARHNYPTKGGASVTREAASVGAPPGFGGAMPGLPPGGLTVNVQVNDRTVATATAAGNAKQRARK